MDFDEISKLFAVIESGMKNHPGKYPHIMAAANNRLQEIENDLAPQSAMADEAAEEADGSAEFEVERR